MRAEAMGKGKIETETAEIAPKNAPKREIREASVFFLLFFAMKCVFFCYEMCFFLFFSKKKYYYYYYYYFTHLLIKPVPNLDFRTLFCTFCDPDPRIS
jgi:hypothetical protein